MAAPTPPTFQDRAKLAEALLSEVRDIAQRADRMCTYHPCDADQDHTEALAECLHDMFRRVGWIAERCAYSVNNSDVHYRAEEWFLAPATIACLAAVWPKIGGGD